MGREVERKYLVKNDAWRRDAGKGTPYRQGYLSTDPERSVRVRVAGDEAFITVKGKERGSGHPEFEYPIPKDEAEELLRDLCLKPLIEKTRYEIHQGEFKWQIDEFGGDNRGLIIAEVETEKDPAEIPKPVWLGEDVTDDERYYNVNLMQHPFRKW